MAQTPQALRKPGARLVEVFIASGEVVDFAISDALHVEAGRLLATVDGERVEAPCEAIVVAVDDEDDGSSRVILRRHSAEPHE